MSSLLTPALLFFLQDETRGSWSQTVGEGIPVTIFQRSADE